MGDAMFLMPLAILMSGAALAAFVWNLSNGQYEDLAGAAERVLYDDRERPGEAPGQLRINREPTSSPAADPFGNSSEDRCAERQPPVRSTQAAEACDREALMQWSTAKIGSSVTQPAED
jgi:cbb3-type cytochrome oxidase maturation protein